MSKATMAELDTARYSRNIGLFGSAGQRKLQASHVAVVGLGGLGCHVVQQLAYLGLQRFVLIDSDITEVSNLNRLVGATENDVGTAKTIVAQRMIRRVQTKARIECITGTLEESSGISALSEADYLFGCVDNDAARLVLTEVSSRNRLSYIDLASDVGRSGGATWFGGRVFVSHEGNHCLSCAGELDQQALAVTAMTSEQRAVDARIYGINRNELDVSGPMVVSINGVVASLAVSEFLFWVTGIRPPRPHLVYRADLGTVTIRNDPRQKSCYYCDRLWRDTK
jgi:molybdopterin-synthase adenylyltransferase